MSKSKISHRLDTEGIFGVNKSGKLVTVIVFLMSWYFMVIPEASGLVIQASTLAQVGKLSS